MSVAPAEALTEAIYPNPEAAAEIESISHEPTAVMVAKAPRGLPEDS